VRTYVTLAGKPGVYFFSLDAGSRMAVKAARFLFHLPYFYADIKADVVSDEVIYRSARRRTRAEFRARYGPISDVRLGEPATLAHWLTERYCPYTIHNEEVYGCDIHHAPWPLQDGSAQIPLNTMATAAGITLPDAPPLLHFSKQQDVLVWPWRRLG